MDEDLKDLFGRLMEDNKQRILRICRAYAHNMQDQQDLFQEIALNIWKSLHSFRNESAIGTWVYRICLNVCMRHSLKLNKAAQLSTPLEGIKITDFAPDAQTDLEQRERIKKLYQCISELDDLDKTVMLLFLEDLSYNMIAEITGISANHVAVKVSRAKKKLANCFNGY
jgi:RNA polymerase sigma-70 factor (ECF subfamily)